MPHAPKQQQSLPLAPQPPSEAEVQAEVVRLLQRRPYWRQRFRTPQEALADPLAAHVLRAGARQVLVERQRRLLQQQ